jgi:hypothetical protein
MSPAFAADDPFAVQVVPSDGRTVTAELVDLDGDGREDLLHGIILGMPPLEQRFWRVYLQRDDGTVPGAPDLEVPIPDGAAVYDIAQVDAGPGFEVLYLQPRGVGILRVSRDAAGNATSQTQLARIPADLTIAAAQDERGLDRLAIATNAFGPEVWLIAPGFGETFFLSPEGELRARIESAARANYFIQPQGPMLAESDIQIFFDSARISVGDINGDSRPDILASGRHELRLFFQGEDGSYPRQPSETIVLGRISFEDHIRGSGSVRTTARDIDGDGLVDLLISQTVGSVMSAASNSYIHFNHGSGWDLDTPDAAFETTKALSADQLIDLDGDGRLEIVRIGIPVSILEVVEIFVQSAIDAFLNAYRLEPRPSDASSTPKPEPWFKTKLAVDLDFETSRPRGFIPTIDFDLNGDAFRDYLSAADGQKIEVFLGSSERGFQRAAVQKMSTEGQIRPGDLNGDGLTDLVLFNTRRLDEPVKLLTNLGRLPDTPTRAVLQPAPSAVHRAPKETE